MYKREFDRLKSTFDAYLFWGEEPYYIRRYAQKVANSLAPKEERLLLYYDEYDFERAKEYLGQNSLFGNRNLLYIKHDKALPKKELQTLIDLCRKNENSYLIYELVGQDGKKIAPLFAADHGAINVRFFKPSLHEAKEELAQRASDLGLQIDPFALQHLLILLDLNLDLAANELEKLSLLDQKIQSKDIDRLVYALTPLNLEKLYEAIILKEPLADLLQKLSQEEQNEMKILLGFESYMRQLFLFYTHMRLHANANSKEILGYKLPRQIEERRIRLAMRIKNYPEIFLTLQECEYQLKTQSNIDKASLLFSYLIKIQALI
ncbi:MAG: DNA polymerase III subunit delta [Epsilonproteobacteria bacterium]|nr:DNA polymerase III subunit delta [Campylobacterota bacterium]